MSRLEQTQSQYELLAQAEVNELSYLDFAQQLAEHELTERTRSWVARHLKQAQLPAHKPMEAFDYRHQTTITKRQVNALLDFGVIGERQNLVFIGPPGVGKTHLAIGIALKAIDAGYKVLFRTALALVEELELAVDSGPGTRRFLSSPHVNVEVVNEECPIAAGDLCFVLIGPMSD